MDPFKLNIGTKDELEICGFIANRNKKIVTIILCILSGGLLLFLLSWKPTIRIKFTHNPCQARDASVFIIKDIYGQIWEESVEDEVLIIKNKTYKKTKCFYNKKIKYIWDEESGIYSRVNYPEVGTRLSGFRSNMEGLSSEDAKRRKQIYGENKIFIEIQTIWNLFIRQTYNPFYLFQAYTITIWCLQTYYIFSGCIFLLSVISITMSIWETRRQAKVLREKMVTQSEVQVLRDEKVIILHSSELVPGDVVMVLKSFDLLEADMVLLEGSIIMNEAILTGESVPITKVHVTANDDEPFDAERHKKHIIFCGTQVLQVRGSAVLRALVVKTGYDTAKGEMVRSILFPKPIDFKIYSDFLKFLFILLPLGFVAMSWSFVHWSKKEDIGWNTVIFNSLDLLTFVVPPILPATITAINLWAQKRLQKQKIFCLSSNYISLAGPVDVVCFDKTGTLTEEDLSLEGVVPCENGEFVPPIYNMSGLPVSSPLCQALATCHSVAMETDGSFIGHPLDIKIFYALQWDICQRSVSVKTQNQFETEPLFEVRPKNDETLNSENEYAVFKTYPFDSGDQRMTVIGRKKSNYFYELFVKGAPEKIASLCTKESVPLSFPSVLDWYTRQGLRVVAAAYKPFPASLDWEGISNTAREVLEENSIFLGLIILQNRLKPETLPALQVIHHAEIATVMITGDNLLTATFVGRQCGLIKKHQQLIFVKAEYVASSVKAAQHLKVHFYNSEQNTGIFTKGKLKSLIHPDYVFGTDGESFQLISQYEPDVFKRLVHRGKIFARMKPDQKIEVVETLQKLGHQVAMCGDGCNDCGALKAAHAGISLSSTEASVAAPFTSLQQDIGCVNNLIREGRATLISTYASFKYNICNCFIALTTVILLFTIYTEPSDTQYLIMDFFLATIPGLVLGNTAASSTLCKQRPSRRIIHPLHIVSILSLLGMQIMLYTLSWEYLKDQSWFVPFNLTSVEPPPEPGYESTVLVQQTFYTFVISAFVFSHGLPFRKPFYNNRMLTVYFILASALCLTFTFCQTEWLYGFIDFKIIPYEGFTWTIFLSIITMAIICYMWESWLLYGVFEKKLIPTFLKWWGPKYPHEFLEKKLKETPNWPTLEEYAPEPKYNDESDDEPPQELEEYEVPADKIHGFFRRSTKRHKFTADVKYVDEKNLTHKTRYKNINYASTPLPPPASPNSDYDYAEPLNESTTEDQKSIKKQNSKDKEGFFKTFQRSFRKRNVPVAEVEPYEVVPFQYNMAEQPNDNIYSHVQGTSDQSQGGEINGTLLDNCPHEQVVLATETMTVEKEPATTQQQQIDVETSEINQINEENGDQGHEEEAHSSMLDDTIGQVDPPNEATSVEQNSPLFQRNDNVSPTGINLIKEMNNEWAKLRNSLHDSMKEHSEEAQQSTEEGSFLDTFPPAPHEAFTNHE